MERLVTELAQRLVEGLDQLSRAGERLLHVHCDHRTEALATKVVDTVTSRASEICIPLRSPCTGSGSEWGVRAVELACWYAAQREERASSGARQWRPLPTELLARPDAQTFAAVLGAVLARLVGEGVVHVVLAPCAARRGLETNILLSLGRALPGHARLICIEHCAPAFDMRSARAEGMRAIELRFDDARLRRALADRLDAMAAAPVGSSGLRSTGAAGPRVAPPVRPGALPPREEDTSRDDAGRARRAVAAFSAALAREEPSQILATRAAAEDALLATGATHIAPRLRLAAAGALASSGRLDEAVRECAHTRRSADAANDPSTAVAALACAAGLVLGAGQLDRARALYAELARLAESTGHVALAAQALRARADLGVRVGDSVDAADALHHAVGLGEQCEGPDRAIVPWAAIAHDLAALLRTHHLHDRASATEHRARALEERARACAGLSSSKADGDE